MPFKGGSPTIADSTADGDEGLSLGGIAGGGLALGAAALLARRPGLLGKVFKGGNALRMQAMLSGFAVPKSMLGNVGAAVEKSVEHGSARPLKELFSVQTLRDFGNAYKNHGHVGPRPGQVNLPGPMPGRIMGAMDSAAQGALRRAGLGADEAENALMQTPLGQNFGKFGTAIEGPVSSYLHPFRRTPFNQFLEGMKAMNRVATSTGTKGERRATQLAMGAGGVHGLATADDSRPVSLPLAIAASGRQGYPYALAALASRYWLGGANTNGGVPGAVLPVSEYGLDQSIRDPLRPFVKPAALTALEKITGY
jgi:hypothetical protein